MKKAKIISMVVGLSVALSAVAVPAMTSFAAEAAPIYGDTVKALESFDNAEGDSAWNRPLVDGTTLADTNGKAILASANGDTAPVSDAGWDISGYKDGGYAFKLRVYAANDMTFPAEGDRDWAFVFGQDLDNNDENNIDRMLRLAYGKSFYLTAGWQELYLPITANFIVDGGDGNWDKLSKITHFRAYDTGSGAGEIYLDEISIVKYNAGQPQYDAATGVLHLDRAEDIGSYMDRRAMYTPGIKKEGAAAAFSFAAHNWIKRAYEPTDAKTAFEAGEVKFWLYLSDPNQVGNMWFELKDADGTALNYQKDGLGTLVAGWQEVTLKLTDGTVRDDDSSVAGFDTSKIVFSHIEANGPDIAPSLLFGIDDLRIVNTAFVPDSGSDGGDKEEPTNVAKGATAESSGNWDDNYTAAMAVDGDLDTRWATVGNWGDEGVENWVKVDLGKSFDISKVNLIFEWQTAEEMESKVPYGVKIEVSADGENWSTYADYSENDDKTVPITATAEATARYVRVEFNKAATEFPSIREIEVYGTAVQAGTATPPSGGQENPPKEDNTSTGVNEIAMTAFAMLILAGAAAVVFRKRGTVK